MKLVKKFNEVDMKDVLSVGGKNASLGEMIKNLSIRKINNPEKVIQLVIEAVKKAGYKPGKDIYISLDSAASSFYKDGKYNMGIGEFTSDEMIEYYKKLINKYPIISIEDGLAEDDWLGWEKMQKEMGNKITLIGDDIFVTNTKLLKKGIDLKAANSILIKPNQIGTLTSAIDAIKLAEVNNFSWVVSHRSGETLDTTIADIAYSTNAFGLKTGSPHQSPECLNRDDVRRTKYLRMAGLEIKKYLEDNFSEKLLKNDSKVVSKIVKYYNGLENGYFKQVVYEYLQHVESKISAKVLAKIQFNLSYVLDVLIEIFEGRKIGSIKSAARQIIEIAEKRTFAGLKVENEMVKQAKKYISKNAEVLKYRNYEKIKNINLWDNNRFGVLCLIRHGETSWSEAVLNKFAAWHQSMITEKGKKEAFKAGVKVKKLGINFNFGFCSDLLRSQETLKLFSKGLGVEDKLNVIENCNIKERNYGMLMGWNREDLSDLVGEKRFKTWRRGYDTDESRPGLGENLMDVKERTIKYFSENVLSKIFNGSNVVLSAHGNSLRSILVYLKELNLGRKLKTEEVMKIEAPLSLPIFIVFDKKTKQIKEYWLDSDDKIDELGKVLNNSDLNGRDLECEETNPLLIKSIEAEEVFDSRKKSTIKVRIRLNNDLVGTWAMVPAGKSTGKGEAPVVSTEIALKNILEIQKVLIAKKFNVFDQKEIDKLLMINLDKWGGNTTLAVSLALAKVASQKKNMELYEYIREVYGYTSKKQSQVAFLMNVFNGGLHALRGNEKLGIDKPAIQEFMIYIKDDSYIKSIQKADNIYWKLKEILFNYGFDNIHFGDEGGYSPRVIKGLNIPDGFATTSDAYFYFLKETGIEEKIKKIVDTIDVNNIKDLQKKSKELQNLILKTDFPELFKKEVLENYEWLCKKYKVKNLAVAVRSSATSEDSVEASFAGQHESFLNVSGADNLLYSIKHCIASLFTERAIAYRHNLKMHYSEVALSVGVQKMVRSDLACSGVMFSCDTESGFPDVVLINSSYGLGENIVKGRVESDQFYVFEKTLALGYMPLLEKRLGRKELTMVYGSKINEVKNLKTPKEKQEKFTLSDKEILELAKYSLMIENHYGHPMDIEWAKDGKDKKLYVVQARPETVQSQKDVQVLKEYIFEDNSKRKEIAIGLSVGNKIGKGKASVIKDIKDISKFKKGDVLIAHMTDPDWVPIMRMASAIVTESGSRTCHAAIVGRELGLPTVVGAYNATKLIKNKQMVTVVCSEGEKGSVYAGDLKYSIKKTDLSKLAKPKVKITMNIGDPNQAFLNSFIPNDGVGLAREEFIVANHIKIHPMALVEYKKQDKNVKDKIDKLTYGYIDKKSFYIDKLAEGIGKITSAFYPKEVILRLSDFKTNEYRNLIGGKRYELNEENPMIGFRGASRYYTDSFRKAFDLELEAIKKVIYVFGLKNLSIMVPFCRTVEEGKKVIKLIKSSGIKDVKIYVMCEIPSNVILVDKFLDIFDGMSIGSNDLTQLTLGIDRDANHLIQNISNENDEAVKELIKVAIQKCKTRGKYIGICGQAPSDYPEFAKFLVENGIDSMSLNPDSVLKIRKELGK